jgi:hypothetical protein
VNEPYIVASWPAVPVEIVRAAGFRPTFAQGVGDATPIADSRLEPQVFPSRLRHLVEAACAGHLRGASRILIPRTSDADYKCFLYLREFRRTAAASVFPPVILFDLLQSHGDDVRAFDVARTHALLDELASASGRMPSDDDRRHEIARTNAARAAARRLIQLRRIAPRVAGTEVFPLLAAFWEMDPDQYVTLADEAARDIAARPPLTGPRVLLSGAPVDDSSLHEAIESRGAVVVAEVGPWGSGAPGEDVRIDDEPVAALADKYRTDVIGPRTPVDTLRLWTERQLDEVDAVVVSLPPDDAVFGWDYPVLRDRLLARGIPHVCLRGSPYESPTPADHARLDAMISAAAQLQEASRG